MGTPSSIVNVDCGASVHNSIIHASKICTMFIRNWRSTMCPFMIEFKLRLDRNI
jgi:hypothetical protein